MSPQYRQIAMPKPFASGMPHWDRRNAGIHWSFRRLDPWLFRQGKLLTGGYTTGFFVGFGTRA